MKFIVWVETRFAGKTLELQQVASLERPSGGIQPEEIGLPACKRPSDACARRSDHQQWSHSQKKLIVRGI